jgi:twitching motility protein PilT
MDKRVVDWLTQVIDREGSDLILAPGSPPAAKIFGELRPLDDKPLTPDDTEQIVRSLLEGRWAEIERERQLDASFSLGRTSRVRMNAFFQRGSVSAVFRMIPYDIPSLEELGVPEVANELCNRRQGFVLVTGPAGHGKSTTLAAMVDRINKTRAVHVITIEDPIEYVHRHQKSIVVQREIGSDAPDFATALRATLRESPDVVLVGEMRDLETIATAITIAETGHLVLATLHTNDTATAIDRIVDVFPPGQQRQVAAQFSQSMLAVFHERLLPRADGNGRVAAFEIMLGTSATRNLIQERRTNQLRNAIRTSSHQGMRTLEADLSRLVSEGLVTAEAAQAVASHPEELRLQLLADQAPEPVRRIRFGRG